MVFLSVPFYSNRPVLNNLIYDYNYKLYRMIQKLQTPNIKLLAVNTFLDHHCKARDGFHLNKLGKLRTFGYISELVSRLTQQVETVSRHVNVSNLRYVTICNDENDNLNF